MSDRILLGPMAGALAGVLIGVGALSLPAIVDAAHHTVSSGTHSDSHTLVEARTCVATSIPRPADVKVSVTIPPTTMLRFDATGHVVAAWTNTGCAPRATDAVYATLVDGSIVRSNAKVLTGIKWKGDFTQSGVFQAQPSGH